MKLHMNKSLIFNFDKNLDLTFCITLLTINLKLVQGLMKFIFQVMLLISCWKNLISLRNFSMKSLSLQLKPWIVMKLIWLMLFI